jgi:hypothetical protein
MISLVGGACRIPTRVGRRAGAARRALRRARTPDRLVPASAVRREVCRDPQWDSPRAMLFPGGEWRAGGIRGHSACWAHVRRKFVEAADGFSNTAAVHQIVVPIQIQRARANAPCGERLGSAMCDGCDGPNRVARYIGRNPSRSPENVRQPPGSANRCRAAPTSGTA